MKYLPTVALANGLLPMQSDHVAQNKDKNMIFPVLQGRAETLVGRSVYLSLQSKLILDEVCQIQSKSDKV